MEGTGLSAEDGTKLGLTHQTFSQRNFRRRREETHQAPVAAPFGEPRCLRCVCRRPSAKTQSGVKRKHLLPRRRKKRTKKKKPSASHFVPLFDAGKPPSGVVIKQPLAPAPTPGLPLGPPPGPSSWAPLLGPPPGPRRCLFIFHHGPPLLCSSFVGFLLLFFFSQQSLSAERLVRLLWKKKKEKKKA